MTSDERFRFDPDGDASLGVQVREIARSQLDAALAALADPGDDVAGAVHEARKCSKKLRGLFRLVRPALGPAFALVDAEVRDAARHLGPLRDAHALAASFDRLVMADDRVVVDLGGVAGELHHRSAAASELLRGDAPQLRAAAGRFRDAAVVVESWTFDGVDEVEVLRDGLAATFRRGRRALETARACPVEEAFHDYRKATKGTWYHLRLLEPVAPAVLAPLAAAFDELADQLGDEHDLAVLAALLEAEAASGRFGDAVEDALFVIDGRRGALQRRILDLGSQLHGTDADAFASFVAAHWRR